jgi:hypothetical protein
VKVDGPTIVLAVPSSDTSLLVMRPVNLLNDMQPPWLVVMTPNGRQRCYTSWMKGHRTEDVCFVGRGFLVPIIHVLHVKS